MALHLFPTPVECKECGAVVDHPTIDHCPQCGALLMERRTPSRLAGVERKHGHLRLLLGFVRFLGIITALVGLLLFIFADDGFTFAGRVLTLLATVLVGTILFIIAALVEVITDLEENTRASFRIQQSIAKQLRPGPVPDES